ncbi:MAG: hypothetical protein HC903_05905 [Methylacidiphilales bacterium]|nr:hypothetical protein [Candidatus Methylacidiphilales bacterium]NJR17882.1 hypothetical protein [Calothrix sp. CSU_2_0]
MNWHEIREIRIFYFLEVPEKLSDRKLEYIAQTTRLCDIALSAYRSHLSHTLKITSSLFP